MISGFSREQVASYFTRRRCWDRLSIGDLGDEVQVCRLPVDSRTDSLASSSAWSNRLWRFTLRVLLRFRRQHVARQPERLLTEGFLTESDIAGTPASLSNDRFRNGTSLKKLCWPLRFDRLSEDHRRRRRADFRSFCSTQANWLDDYALFRALKDLHGGRSWNEWGSAPRESRSDRAE